MVQYIYLLYTYIWFIQYTVHLYWYSTYRMPKGITIKYSVQYTTGTVHMGCTLHRGIIIKNLYSTLLVQYIQDAQGKQAEYFKNT